MFGFNKKKKENPLAKKRKELFSSQLPNRNKRKLFKPRTFQLRQKISNITEGAKNIFTKIRYILIVGMVLFITYIGYYIVIKTDLFSIKSVAYIGEVNAEIKEKVDDSKGKNSLLFNPPSEFYAYKTIDGVVTLEPKESLAKYYYLNFTGSYILDPRGKILSKQGIPAQFLTELDKKVMKGEQVDEKVYQELYDSNLPEDQKSNTWNKLPVEQKQEYIANTRNNIFAKVDNYIKETRADLMNNQNMPIGYWEDNFTQYEIGDYLLNEDLRFIAKIFDQLLGKNYKIISVQKMSKVSFKTVLDINKEIYWSNKRDLTEQFKDLDVLIFYSVFDQAKVIDLRTENISVIK